MISSNEIINDGLSIYFTKRYHTSLSVIAFFCFILEEIIMSKSVTDSDSDNSVKNEVIETKQITVAVQQGQRRRVMKGMTYNTDEKHGYIYLVRTREFKSLNQQIYKVGRTSQCPDTRITRLHKYTKGSEIYLILQCHINDVGLIEKEILQKFCLKWNPGPDGSEDFIIPTFRELMEAKQIIFDTIREYEEKRI